MASFRANPAFDEEMQAEPRFQKGMREIGNGVARKADQLAHRIMPRHRTAEIRVVREGSEIFVVNTSHGGHIDEFGSQNNPAYSPIRRGVRAAGLRLDERPKT